LASTTEQLNALKALLDSSEKAKFEVGMQLEKTSKEKAVLSEMNLQLEERRVLLESEREKAVGVLVREKDVLSRANFKLLQLLEYKDQAVKGILKCLEQGEEKVEVGSVLGADRDI
jgi:hypothetical protein